ncbi:hypothetical protein LTS10_004536 [Elasticomyces elasticus]|nr:hypothetical protein LTS10_004536 [Elasticomyces elasticus]
MANTTPVPNDRFLAVYWMHRAKRFEMENESLRAHVKNIPDCLQTVRQYTNSQHTTNQHASASMDSDELMRELYLQGERVKNLDLQDMLCIAECEPAREDELRTEGAADLRSTTLLGWIECQWVAGLTLLAMGVLLARREGGHA